MSDLIAAITDVLYLKAKAGESESQRQLNAIKAFGFTSLQSFFSAIRDAIVKKQPVSGKIIEDDIIGLINMFGSAFVRNFHGDESLLFSKISDSKKKEIKDFSKYKEFLNLAYTEEVDAYGMPIS